MLWCHVPISCAARRLLHGVSQPRLGRVPPSTVGETGLSGRRVSDSGRQMISSSRGADAMPDAPMSQAAAVGVFLGIGGIAKSMTPRWPVS